MNGVKFCFQEELEQHRQTVKNEKHVYRHDLKSGLSGINDKVEARKESVLDQFNPIRLGLPSAFSLSEA